MEYWVGMTPEKVLSPVQEKGTQTKRVSELSCDELIQHTVQMMTGQESKFNRRTSKRLGRETHPHRNI
jgi:hypothetical protein